MIATDNGILADLKNKSFYKIAENIKKLTAIEQFRINEEWTDYLQDRVDFGNKYLLKGFQYRLIMEEV
jgi:hypothetical protein